MYCSASPNCASLGKAASRARQGCSAPERGACNDLYAFGRASAWSVPSKGRPRCRELLAVVQGPQTLRHGDRLVGPELSLLAHRVLDTLRRDFHEDAALQHRARVRVEDLVKRASAPLKPFEHEVRRANLRHVVQVVVEFRQVLHRDDPERLRRHLHVVVATFDGGWHVGRQSEEMLQRVHSPALGADVAAADLKLVQEQRPLVTQEVALDRGSQHVRAGHHHELVQARVAGTRSTSFARRELARRPRKVQWLLLVDLGVVPPAVHGALVDDEVGHQKLAMARHQQALRLQLVVLELLAELHEGPALQVHELVLSVRRALAGVQGLVASEGRVELDEMALELGRRHVAVVLQNPSWRRRCCNKAIVLAPTHGPHGPLLLQAVGHQLHDIVKLPLAKLVELGGRRRMGQQLHGGLVEEDPQVCPSFGSKHDVVADVRRLSLVQAQPLPWYLSSPTL